MARRRESDPLSTFIGLVMVVGGSVALFFLLTTAGLPWQPMVAIVLAFAVAIIFGVRY